MARNEAKINKHASQLGIALYEGDSEKARHEYKRLQKHDPRLKGKSFEQAVREIREPHNPGFSKMEKRP